MGRRGPLVQPSLRASFDLNSINGHTLQKSAAQTPLLWVPAVGRSVMMNPVNLKLLTRREQQQKPEGQYSTPGPDAKPSSEVPFGLGSHYRCNPRTGEANIAAPVPLKVD